MSLATALQDRYHAPPSEEARRRMAFAQENDLAFLVRRVARTPLADDDVFLLASALNEAMASSPSVSKSRIVALMRAKGKTPEQAEELAAAIIR